MKKEHEDGVILIEKKFKPDKKAAREVIKFAKEETQAREYLKYIGFHRYVCWRCEEESTFLLIFGQRCPNCGANQRINVEKNKKLKIVVCGGCGFENPEFTKHCYFCGIKKG